MRKVPTTQIRKERRTGFRRYSVDSTCGDVSANRKLTPLLSLVTLHDINLYFPFKKNFFVTFNRKEYMLYDVISLNFVARDYFLVKTFDSFQISYIILMIAFK